MPLSPEITPWAGPAPAVNTNIVDLQRALGQIIANINSIPAGSISGDQIENGTITEANIVTGTLTSGSIAAGSIVAGDIATHTLTATQIAAGTITANEIHAATITATQIAAGGITAAVIAANTITSGQIAANTITAGQIAANTITATQIAASTITAGQIAANTITSAQIASGTITATQISATAGITAPMLTITVGGGNLAPNSSFESQTTAYLGGNLGTGYIFNLTVPGSAAGTIVASGRQGGNCISLTTPATGTGAFSVDNRDIAATPNTKVPVTPGNKYTNSIWVNPTVTGTYTLYMQFHITAAGTYTGTVITSKVCPANTWTRITNTATCPAGYYFASMYLYQAAATLSCTTLVDDYQIEEGDIATAYSPKPDEVLPGSVTGGMIAGTTITGANIATGAISASTMFATGVVNAAAISVTNLAAVSTSMGTVTGGIFQTNTSGARVMMGSSMTTPSGVTAGIVGIDTSNNVTFSIDATTGNVVLKGQILTGSTGLGNIAGITQNAVLAVAGNNIITNGDLTAATPLPANGTNYTLARDTTTYLTGPASMKATITAAGSGILTLLVGGSATWTVTAAQIYSSAAYVLTPAVRSGAYIQIEWLGSGGTHLSYSTSAFISTTANGWTRLAVENQTAPAGALSARVYVVIPGGAASEVHYFDNFIFTNAAVASNGQIVAGSITATEIAVGTITANLMNVATLSAITANLGTVTAGAMTSVSLTSGTISGGTITGTTITGGTVQTSATGARTVIDSTGFYITDSGGSAKLITLNPTTGLSIVGGAAGPTATSGIDWYDPNTPTNLVGLFQTTVYTAPAFPGTYMSITAQKTGNSAVFASLRIAYDTGTSRGNSVAAIVTNAAGTTQYPVTILDSAGTSDFVFSNKLQFGASQVVTIGMPSRIWLPANVTAVPSGWNPLTTMTPSNTDAEGLFAGGWYGLIIYTGWYRIEFNVTFDYNAGGMQEVAIGLSNNPFPTIYAQGGTITHSVVSGETPEQMSYADTLYLGAGTYVMPAFYTSGASCRINTPYTSLAIQRVG